MIQKSQPAPVSKLAPFGVRLQPELKDWLVKQATQNHRSLNSELVKRLEDSREMDRQANGQ